MTLDDLAAGGDWPCLARNQAGKSCSRRDERRVEGRRHGRLSTHTPIVTVPVSARIPYAVHDRVIRRGNGPVAGLTFAAAGAPLPRPTMGFDDLGQEGGDDA